MTPRAVHIPALVADSERGEQARVRATTASILSLLLGFAPVVITLAAVLLGPSLPYPVAALVSFVLVAACIALALASGIRGVLLVRYCASQLPPVGSRAFGSSVVQEPDRGLGTLRVLSIVGIAQAGLHGLFFLGSVALTVPGLVWLMSITR